MLRDALLDAAAHSNLVISKGDHGFEAVLYGPVLDADPARRRIGAVHMDRPSRRGVFPIDQSPREDELRTCLFRAQPKRAFVT